MKAIMLALAMTGAALAATPAMADDATIQYKDLDLTTPQGQKALEQRIDRTARQLCGMNEHSTGTRANSADQKRCYAKVKTQAKDSIAAAVSRGQLGG